MYDNLIHNQTFHDYIAALEQLFIALQKFRLKLNLEDFTFLASGAKFLSHIVNSKGFRIHSCYF